MGHASDHRLLMLHALRLRGFVPADVLADGTGFAVADVEATLVDLDAGGLARYREGRMTGWMLTPDGRAEGERLLADELDAAGRRDLVMACYEAFLARNSEMLEVCTAWQMREEDGEQKVNDHRDVAYDADVIERLGVLDATVQPICADLADGLARFAGYGPRFTSSLEKIRMGDSDWFTKPMIDSYHTTWFELHENLLASLGIDRASEGAH
ncbi:MAG: transcriptional regulator [Acidimicrobiia bacterium]|nr:transcriptional regulator [Acidimicrobiia bacterium]